MWLLDQRYGRSSFNYTEMSRDSKNAAGYPAAFPKHYRSPISASDTYSIAKGTHIQVTEQRYSLP